MNLEQLNKSQIVLLTLLVSFVTSIATGIVTVSLVEKAPTDVTRVVQRVVERTVEQVAPADQQATVITKEKTVIVREADLIAAAVAQNKSRIIAIRSGSTGAVVTYGVRIDASGTIATDAGALVASGAYYVAAEEETRVPLSVVADGGARGVALLAPPQDETLPQEAVTPSEIPLQLGQTVVALVGGETIATGLVSALGDGGYVETDIDPKYIVSGTVLINVDGEAIGISTHASREHAPAAFVPIRAVVALLTATGAEGDTPADTGGATTTAAQAR